MNSGSVALWETQHNNAEEDCFKILILREALKTQNQHQVDSYAFSEVKRANQLDVQEKDLSLTQLNRS